MFIREFWQKGFLVSVWYEWGYKKKHKMNKTIILFWFHMIYIDQKYIEYTSLDGSFRIGWQKTPIGTDLIMPFCFFSEIKQFVVMNCSKDQSGSIVNETLKTGISILINTSKESNFYAYFKYISFIKFSPTQHKLRAWENLPCFGK